MPIIIMTTPSSKVRAMVAFLCFSVALSMPDTSQEEDGIMGQAERFIKAFNLMPGTMSTANEQASTREGTIIEHRLHLNIGGDLHISDEDLGHHAGYFSIQGTHSSRMFYMFFESRGNKQEDPLVLWMSGGPGCSSSVALFYENGPFKITDDLTLAWNEYGWDKAANLIYVDQPIGTGFSYTNDSRDIRRDEKGVSEDMYQFLQAFFQAHPEFVSNNFFVTGESYAGHYVPAVTSHIHEANKAKEGSFINLKGFAIGNGLTNPEIQYAAYADYALQMGLIDENEHDSINSMYPECKSAINQCGNSGTDTCADAYMVCNNIFNSIMGLIGDVNYYDIRTMCMGSLCYDFSNMETYLNEDKVRAALGVGDRKFVSCSSRVYSDMIVDWMRNLAVDIPSLLEDNIQLLVYAGEYDLICNWLGNSRWVDAMDWSGKEMYATASSEKFLVDGMEAGVFSSSGPLTFLKVHNAGHMVPMDQPKASLEMIRRFISGTPLDQGLLENVATFNGKHIPL